MHVVTEKSLIALQYLQNLCLLQQIILIKLNAHESSVRNWQLEILN